MVLLALVSSRAEARSASDALYVVAIGQNEVPTELGVKEPGLARLHFADDDAVQLYALMQSASHKAYLLTVPDVETQTRFPWAVQTAISPSRTNLDQTLAEIASAMQLDRTQGREPVLVFFYSGHGVREGNGQAALALLDATLTQEYLYKNLLGALPAKYVHLIVDACHAGAVVRSRDVDATLEPLSAEDVRRYVDEATLDRFPNVGAILASTASTQSFEWDAYRGGVFAHELLSGLRGAADVNGDGRIEYSELAAFLSAANLRVADARAHLEIVTTPPRTNARAPLFDHQGVRGEFRLTGQSRGAWADGFRVESASGARLLDVFPERDASLSLFLPADERLFLLHGDQEVEVSGGAGSEVKLGALEPHPVRKRARDGLEASLNRGLFGTRYGPAFYLGFTSQRSDFSVVPIDPDRDATSHAVAHAQADGPARASLQRSLGIGFLAASGVAAITTSVFAGKALAARGDYDTAKYEEPAAHATERYNRFGTAAWIAGGATAALATTGVVLLLTAPTEPATGVALGSRTRLGLGPARISLSGVFW
jgi:hypothetical protein